MTTKFLVKIIIAVSLCFSVVSSQSVLGIQYPTGLPATPASGASAGMGNTGTGVQNDFYGMAKNPANLGISNRAVFISLLSFDFVNYSEKGNASSQFVFDPQLLSFSFPLNFLGTIGFAIDQKSNTDLKFSLQQTDPVNPTFTNRLLLKRNGGMSSWQFGWGYSIKKYAQIGLAYERVFFTDRQTIYKETNSSIGSIITDSSVTTYRGNGFRGGVMVPVKDLTLGLSGEYIFMNEATRHRYLRGIISDSTRTDSLISSDPVTFDFKPAPSLAFGASYRFSPELFAAVDIGATFWERFYSELDSERSLDRAYSFGAGIQYIPAPNLLSPKYYEIIQYRAGIRFNQLPVSGAAEFNADIGFGLPVQQGGSVFDVNFRYGRRWDSSIKDYSENIFSIQLGINGGRKWYQSAEKSY